MTSSNWLSPLPIEDISLRENRLADFLDMAMVRATATAEHVQIHELVAQLSVLSTELVGISDIELSGFVEFFMAFRRGVRSQAADSCRPRRVAIQHASEMARMRAVNHIVSR